MVDDGQPSRSFASPDGFSYGGLAEFIEAAEQHLAYSNPPSPRSRGKREAAEQPFDQHSTFNIDQQDGTGPLSHLRSSSGAAASGNEQGPSSAAAFQHSWSDWFCCDIDHTAAASCSDCVATGCDPAPGEGGHCDAGTCAGPAKVVACCEASPCAALPAEICDGVHSSVTACFDPTCTGSPPCTVPVATCCDRTDCVEEEKQPCSVIATECCDEPHCADAHGGSPSVMADDCPDCKLPFSKVDEQGRGRMYSSFQELLDCCCCRSSFPESGDCHPKAVSEASPSNATYPTASPRMRHQAHSSLVPRSHGLSTSRNGVEALVEQQDHAQSETPSSTAHLSSHKTPTAHDFSSYSPSVTISTVSTPYAAVQPNQNKLSASSGESTKHTSQHSRSPSVIASHHHLSLDPKQHSMTPEPQADLNTSFGSTATCYYPQPHDHSAAGACLPPSWTLCNATACGATGAHSRLYGEALPVNFSTVSEPRPYHQISMATQQHAEEDARRQQCQWAGCSERFWTVEELVAHVNHAHLARKQQGSVQATDAMASGMVNSAWHFNQYDAQLGNTQQAPSAHAALPSPLDAGAMPCMWNDCHTVSVPDKDVQLDEVVTMLREAGMQWPVETNVINDKASAAMLQHLLTAHLGQPDQHGHQHQHGIPASAPGGLGPITNSANKKTHRTHTGKRSRSATSELTEDGGSTPQAVGKKSRSSSIGKAESHHGHGEDRCCDNIKIGADGTKGHVCGWEGCSEVFPDHQSLTEHITGVHVGAGKAVYECRWVGCERAAEGRQFTQKQKVLRHIQTHTGDRPHKCEVCGRRFSEPNTLAQHMRTHTQEKPYVCDFPGCGKAFSVTGSLTIHKRIHSGAKPFVCKFHGCGKAFAESSNLTKHMRIHSGEKPFECPECGKRFSRPDQVSRHRKTHERKRNKARAGGEEDRVEEDEAEEAEAEADADADD